jgi:hypothetical protein
MHKRLCNYLVEGFGAPAKAVVEKRLNVMDASPLALNVPPQALSALGYKPKIELPLVDSKIHSFFLFLSVSL